MHHSDSGGVQVVDHIRQLDVLLVEDDEVDIMNVERCFRKQNIQHRLQIAHDGLEALDYLRSANGKLPQVIILDINMPRMNGLEFLGELRSDPALCNLTVFVMSTSSNHTDKTNAYRYNIAGYIIKPLTAEEFGNSLQMLMRFFDICEFP